MNGVQIEYFFGIFFTIESIKWEGGRVSADAFKLIVGLLLLFVAFFGKSLIA
jgi:hypothetical protein